MARHDYGHFDETQLGKPYDVKLLKRLWPFIRPQRRLLSLAIFLVIVITVLDLSTPYVTKLAIDRYIVPSAETEIDGQDTTVSNRRLYRVDIADPSLHAVVQRYPALFTIDNQTAAIDYEDLPSLSAADRSLLRRSDVEGVTAMAVVLLVLIVLSFVLNFIQMMIMEYAGQMVMHNLRMQLFRHAQQLSAAFFSRNPIARLTTRVTNDIQNMYELFTSVLVFVFKDLFLLTGIAAVLLSINWKLSLVSFLVLPVVVWASLYFAGLARDVFRDLRIKVAEINTRFSETIDGMSIIQLYGHQDLNEKRFRKLNHENYLSGMRQIHVFAVFMPLIELLASVSLAIIIWYGGGSVLDGKLSLGSLVAFISYMRMFFRPIRDIAEKYNVMQNAMASAERIFLLMDSDQRPVQIPSQPTTQTDGRQRSLSLAEIRFEDVSFAYVEGEPVLKNISLKLRKGETMALVGPTGSGKTTLIQLIYRFYDATGGKVLVDGKDIRAIDMRQLREKMALVSQDPFLFSASVADNIRIGRSDISDGELSGVLKDAGCEHLVRRLNGGPDATLSQGGRNLSSGERQLLSIARAMARKPELIILDEATSYVDSHTEEEIQAALRRLLIGKTAIVVAHRLSTARSADRIVVLNRGRIIESGSHEKLMEMGGFYFNLNKLQN